MSRIFISYRREDSSGYALFLFDRLSQQFGRENLFMDLDTIEPGLDFVEMIENAVSACDVLLAIIGRHWLAITDETGQRRLENPEDFVRLEIATALERKIRVIPVLVGGAPIPRSRDLPEVLQKLARRHAHEISDTRFHADTDRLIGIVKKVLEVSAVAPQQEASTVEAPPQLQEEETTPRQPSPRSTVPPIIQERDGIELVLIPAGKFLMGSDPQKDKEAYADEQPQHTLHLPDFCIAKTSITNAQYAAFVQATDHRILGHWTDKRPPSDKADHPVVNVSWHDAMAYCHWLSEVTGKSYSLPSEAEWEKAAGWDPQAERKLIYPWGDEWDATRCNTHEGGPRATMRVGAYPQGTSPYGVLDMAGNVWEWTRSLHRDYPYKPNDGREDRKAKGARALRGGSWYFDHRFARLSYRTHSNPDNFDYDVGFRVVVAPGS